MQNENPVGDAHPACPERTRRERVRCDGRVEGPLFQARNASSLISTGCAHLAQTSLAENAASLFLSYRCAHLQKQWGVVWLSFAHCFALLPKAVNSSLFFSIASALFAQNNRGVPLYPEVSFERVILPNLERAFSLRLASFVRPIVLPPKRAARLPAVAGPSAESRLWRLPMDRSILSALLGSLLGISGLGILGMVANPGANPMPEPSNPPKGEGGWRLLNPITYENISVFPVVASYTADTSHFLTLEEGLASGEVTVSEQGAAGLARSRDGRVRPTYNTGASVNQLVLINRSKRPLLLLAGELVSGGKQDRIIGKDRIVPAGAEPLPLDVFCVEHGRWSSGANFSAAKTIVHPSVREQAAVKQKQEDVWAAVRGGTTYSAGAGSGTGGAPAPAAPPRVSREALSETVEVEAQTESYDKLYNRSRRIGGDVDSLVTEMQRRFARETSGLKGERVVGVVVAYGGDVAWSDIFASEDLFYKYWTKLLRSYAVEALARPTYREVADRGDAEQFLTSLKGVIREETEPGVYRWREIREGRLSQIELDALEPKPLTLHRLLLHRTS